MVPAPCNFTVLVHPDDTFRLPWPGSEALVLWGMVLHEVVGMVIEGTWRRRDLFTGERLVSLRNVFVTKDTKEALRTRRFFWFDSRQRTALMSVF